MFWNSLEGELCFDDMFAVLHNADTRPDSPYPPIWRHDFWGKDIGTTQSHKSYRPVTITYFRMIRCYTLSAYNHNPDAFLINNVSMKESDYPEHIHREKDLQPIHFHIGNIALHTWNCLMIRSVVSTLLHHHSTLQSSVSDIALVSALLFSTHPIHCEAVSNIVGAAELLSCLFALISFQCFVAGHSTFISSTSISEETNRKQIQSGQLIPSLCKSHSFKSSVFSVFWCTISLTAYYLSALSKEGGVTIAALMSLHSLYLFWKQWREFMLFKPSNPNTQTPSHGTLCCNMFVHSLFMIVPVLWLFGYIQMRQYIAGSALGIGPELIRKAENPVAVSPDFTTRLLTIPYIHSYYASLLLFPHPLSADYSFDCISLIHSLYDHRNLYWMAMYFMMFFLLLYHGFQVAASLFQRKTFSTTSTKCFTSHSLERSWLVLTVFAWLIVPFIPASNIFFFVGTFVAERLLYFPSIAFCLLISLLLHYLKSLWMQIGFVAKTGTSTMPLYSIMTVIIISLYSHKTMNRNLDWKDEETLFESAYKVCPDSVKVLQNMAILQRRHERYDDALDHLFRAKTIDPSLCSVDHWIGVTLINQNKLMPALRYLKSALHCKFTLQSTGVALQKLFQILMEWDPNHPLLLHEWALILYQIGQSEQGSYHYYQQSLNVLIVGAMERLNLEHNFKNEMDALTGNVTVYRDRIQFAERIEDIINKLEARDRDQLLGENQRLEHITDCFHRFGRMIAEYQRIRYFLDEITGNHNGFGIRREDVLVPEEGKILDSWKSLAENVWAFINEKRACRQDYETSDVGPWQRTHKHFATKLMDVILERVGTHYVGEEDFWDVLAVDFEILQRDWNELRGNAVHSEPMNDGGECREKIKRLHTVLNDTLGQKSRNEHFVELVNRRESIERIVDKLKEMAVETDCDRKWKMLSLEGLAIIVTPYVNVEERKWNFDGLLDNEWVVQQVMRSGNQMNVDPMIHMIAALYQYLQTKMNEIDSVP